MHNLPERRTDGHGRKPLSYRLSGLSIGDGYTIEPAIAPRTYNYVANISAASAPTLTITATPYDSGATVEMTDGVNENEGGTWTSYSYLPSDGGTKVISISTTYGGITTDYTLTINFTKTTT